MIQPYYADDTVQLFCGDCREVLPRLGMTFDAVITDPPYAETGFAWDKWATGWPRVVKDFTSSMWCFGTMRMFMRRLDEFSDWRFGQDLVWEKQGGISVSVDRFRRVHELIVHFYQGAWDSLHRKVPRIPHVGRNASSTGRNGAGVFSGLNKRSEYVDDGMRLMRSVIYANNMQRRNVHPTEKPIQILIPLVEYSTHASGVVLDPFAGSGSTLEAARLLNRKAVGIELDERYCEIAASRLRQGIMNIEESP